MRWVYIHIHTRQPGGMRLWLGARVSRLTGGRKFQDTSARIPVIPSSLSQVDGCGLGSSMAYRPPKKEEVVVSPIECVAVKASVLIASGWRLANKGRNRRQLGRKLRSKKGLWADRA